MTHAVLALLALGASTRAHMRLINRLDATTGCGNAGELACVGDNGVRFCVSPSPDNATIQSSRIGNSYICLACGLLNEFACVNHSTGLHWCVSPSATGAEVTPSNRTGGAYRCVTCGVAGERACYDDAGNHACTSPGPDNKTVQAFDEGGDYMCMVCGIANQHACISGGNSWCTSPSADGHAVQATNGTNGRMECTECGELGMPACFDPSTKVHSCTSPAPHGSLVGAAVDEHGVHMCALCDYEGTPNCTTS
jgi:hypothetical protein